VSAHGSDIAVAGDNTVARLLVTAARRFRAGLLGSARGRVEDPLQEALQQPAIGGGEGIGHRPLGATGNAGRMAVQVARRLGAERIIGAARDAGKLATLPALGATETITLGDAGLAAEVDVVIDYLWGAPPAAAIVAIVSARADRDRPLSWIQIGSVAGSAAPIPSEALRAARLQILGSGQGSVSTAQILAELPALAGEITGKRFQIDARPMALADVEQAWAQAPASTQRIVLTP
jgi:NADPH:quinone reductase-like Zn-dependent oxidoreductase